MYVLAVCFALFVGLLDVVIGVLSYSGELSQSAALFSSVATTSTVALAIFCLLLVLLHRYLAGRTPSQRLATGIALAVFLTTFVATAEIAQFADSARSLTTAAKLAMLMVFAAVTGVGSYFFIAAHSQRTLTHPRLLRSMLAVTFLLGETAFLVWLLRYRVGSAASWQAVTMILGYLALVAMTLKAVSLVRAERTAAWLASGAYVLMLVGAVLPPVLTTVVGSGLRRSGSEGHDVRRVVLVTIDTLRADVLSPKRGQQPATPNLAALGADGVIFSQALTVAPWTLPAVTSIMTGLPPTVHSATTSRSRVPDSLPTLAEAMRAHGYYTRAFVSNPYLHPAFNLDQGFVEYDAYIGSPTTRPGRPLGLRLLSLLGRDHVSTDELTRRAIAWLRKNADADFFLWIHYFDPHAPYAPPGGYLPAGDAPSRIGNSFDEEKDTRTGYFAPTVEEGDWIRRLYGAEVEWVDHNIGLLIDALKELDLYDGALMIATSDHGEEFWEHGSFEHGHTLYNEVLQVPLIVKLPDTVGGTRVDAAVSIESVMPTILDVCAIPYEDPYLASRSLLPALEQQDIGAGLAPVVSTGMLYFEERISIVSKGVKYIHSLLSDREELYLLAEDPGEQRSVESDHPDLVQAARAQLLEHAETADAIRDRYEITVAEDASLDLATAEQLKSLGYLQ